MQRTVLPLPFPPSRRILPFLIVAGLILLLLSVAACGAKGDIEPGSGAAGVRLGDDRAAVEKALGKPEKENTSGIHGAQGTKELTYLLYPGKGLDVLLEDGRVRSIFLYHEGADDHRQYPGRTSGGLTLASRRDDVLRILGQPSARGIGQDADRWFRYDSGLEVSFQADGTLHHLVIVRKP